MLSTLGSIGVIDGISEAGIDGMRSLLISPTVLGEVPPLNKVSAASQMELSIP